MYSCGSLLEGPNLNKEMEMEMADRKSIVDDKMKKALTELGEVLWLSSLIDPDDKERPYHRLTDDQLRAYMLYTYQEVNKHASGCGNDSFIGKTVGCLDYVGSEWKMPSDKYSCAEGMMHLTEQLSDMYREVHLREDKVNG